MKVVCIIPARGGSKRIFKKNLKEFLGKPIIAYSIQNAKESGIFSEIYVSSDSEEILAFARSKGVVALKRPESLSGDYVGTREVIVHCIEELGLDEVWVCCLYATAPLLKVESLRNAFLQCDKSCYLFSAVEYSYSPYRAFMIKNNKNVMLFPEFFLKRSQDLEKVYHDAGQFYFARSNIWQERQNIFEDSKSFVLSPFEVQDIDTLEDWKLAEMKYIMMNNC
ncbi:pseudaminic acid cytidylyltransferase [Helicobacter mesocricetorum]|uniref:pseudaminic acid cytidylyltransferase n=1 Tax=Helicobacter mesocricetorum TaxID=87012 RepID=UPI000CF10179|nr:pseudaminic acid cytidylyltransferase [Helicobacter mesocricetorum]